MTARCIFFVSNCFRYTTKRLFTNLHVFYRICGYRNDSSEQDSQLKQNFEAFIRQNFRKQKVNFL